MPDLVHVEAVLRRSVCGLPIVDARVGDPVVLRLMVTEPFPDVLNGIVESGDQHGGGIGSGRGSGGRGGGGKRGGGGGRVG